jgi:hypothetical protein
MKLLYKSTLIQDEYATQITTNLNSPIYTVLTTNNNLYTYRLSNHTWKTQHYTSFYANPALAMNDKFYLERSNHESIGFECLQLNNCKLPETIIASNKICKILYMHDLNYIIFSQIDSTLVIHDLKLNKIIHKIRFKEDIKELLTYEKNLLVLTSLGNLYKVSCLTGDYELLINKIDAISSVLKNRVLLVKNNNLLRYNLVKRKSEKTYKINPIEQYITQINFFSMKGNAIAHVVVKEVKNDLQKERTMDSYIINTKVERQILYIYDIFNNEFKVEI